MKATTKKASRDGMDGEQLNSFGSARRLVLRVEAKAPKQQTTPHETLEESLPTPPAHSLRRACH